MLVKESKEYNNVEKHTRNGIALGLFWIMAVVTQAVSGFLGLFSSSLSSIATIILYLVLIYGLVQNGVIKVARRISSLEVWIFFGFLFSIAITYALHPSNISYMGSFFNTIPFMLLAYIVGKLFSVVPDLLPKLRTASIIGIGLAFFAYYFILNQTIKDMSLSYTLLPAVLVVIDGAFQEEKRYIYILWSILGIVLLFLLATRGPLLIAIIYLAYKFFDIKSTKKVLASIAIISVGVITYFTNAYSSLIQMLYTFLLRKQYNNYMIQMFLLGNTKSEDMRVEYIQTLWQSLKQKPISGYGLFGDRVILNGTYAHNIIMEILYSFGLFLGVAIIIFLGWLIIKTIKNCNVMEKKTILILCVFGLGIKFLISGSFLIDTKFYLLLGIVVGMYNAEKRDALC